MRHFKGKVAISIIAILICMAFVFNFGTTLAVVSYSFLGVSKASPTKAESYVEHAMATDALGAYAYSFGSVNGKLSINYGFSAEYDLKVEFTAKYHNTNHKANDFELNFVNRDDWCISLITATTNSPSTSQMVYNLSSNTNEFSGTMYYLGKLSGSGTIDLISGVTFYNNGTQDYKNGDLLEVNFDSYYVKSSTDNYKLSTESPTHSFYAGANVTAYDNWIKYMRSSNGYLTESTYMIYNAYPNDTYALAYPSDFTWATDFDLSSQTEPANSNTAYRYTITKTNSGNVRVLEGLTAGNTYRGGLGVFVFPSQRSKVRLVVNAYWEKDGVVQGTMPNNTIHLQISSDLDSDMCSKDITKPTYINVLESIMLTAEARYRDILINGYKMVLSNVSVEITASLSTEHAELDYQVNNPTAKAPILARYKDIAVSSQLQQAKVTATNLKDSAIRINSFTVKGKLWYADYTAVDQGGEASIQVFAEQVKGYLGVSNIKYNTTLWSTSTFGDTITFTAKSNSFSTYIASGYEMPLISAVTIPDQSGDLSSLVNVGDEIYVHDLWCSLEVNITSYSQVTEFSTSGSNYAIEVVTPSYDYSAGDICVRNNTNQTITSVTLSNLTLARLTQTSGNPRDNMDASASFEYTLQAFGVNGARYVSPTGALSQTMPSSKPSSSSALSITIDVNLMPNDCTTVFRITSTSRGIIYDYQISANMSGGEANADARLIRTAYPKGENTESYPSTILINNSSNKYEFRLKFNFDVSQCLQCVVDNNSNVPANFSFAESGGYYYAYYKGVINQGQIMEFAINQATAGGVNSAEYIALEVELIQHADGVIDSHYTAGNYSSWNPPAEWLTSMQNIYKVLNTSDLETA